MDHRRIEASIPGFALGCLDPDESDQVQAHLSTCASCQALLRSYEQTVGHLAHGIPPIAPRSSLKADLMHRITAHSTARPAYHPQPARFLASLFRWFSPALAIASLVIIISLTAANIVQWQQTRSATQQLSAPLKIFKMRGTPLAPHADGTFVIGQNQLQGVLVASDLPAIAPNQQFQLWLIKNGEPANGGTFLTTSLGYGVMQITSAHPLPEYQSATVTIEPAGGSSTPSGPELMVGRFMN